MGHRANLTTGSDEEDTDRSFNISEDEEGDMNVEDNLLPSSSGAVAGSSSNMGETASSSVDATSTQEQPAWIKHRQTAYNQRLMSCFNRDQTQAKAID